jgi:hypothetical protein
MHATDGGACSSARYAVMPKNRPNAAGIASQRWRSVRRPDYRFVRHAIAGASPLVKYVQTARSSRQGALSLTSIASRLAPHRGSRCTRQSQVGFKAASLWLLIARAPLTTMAERRHCAVGEPAGRRFSRAGPWMAHRGDPRSNAGERACRALARHRVVGQSLLLPFWCLKKGVAVKAKP